MFERTVTPEDLARLERQRQDAERAYNEGLTRLDQALPRPFEAPPARLTAHLAETLTFQSRLVQYLQRITPFVDTKNREVAGLMRRINEDNGAAIAGLIAGLEELAAGQRGLHEAVQVLQGKQHGMRESLQVLQGAQRVAAREARRLRDRRGDPDAAAAPAPLAAAEPPPPADAVTYAVFEDAFRGSTADIANRQRRYLPCFEGASEVLDVGCGRGEFLELLRDGGIDARGIDANAEMVERCRERGLDVTRTDALAYVAALPGESLGGLFAAQVVEHLEADYLLQLLAAAQRALAPSARVVLETINPACWSAFFSSYLRDITHRHPLHPGTLSYLLRAHGFVDVEIVYSAPVPDAHRLQRVQPAAAPGDAAGDALRALIDAFNGNVDRLNGQLFGYQDYAAVGTRG